MTQPKPSPMRKLMIKAAIGFVVGFAGTLAVYFIFFR
jgi:hypothetical protein